VTALPNVGFARGRGLNYERLERRERGRVAGGRNQNDDVVFTCQDDEPIPFDPFGPEVEYETWNC
jgi:hypothetical protein